jgi:hypothetical protein
MNRFRQNVPLMLAAVVIAAMFACPITAIAETTSTTITSTAPDEATAPATVVLESTDSETTRREFNELLQRHPPEVGKTLKLSPTLFSNPSYLANYPSLQQFVAKHPEVTHSPGYYLDHVYVPGDPTPRTASMAMLESTMEGIAVFSVMLMITLALTWLIKTLIDHRRWSRISKVQAEVHNKLLDRFASNEELLAYVQTPAGQQFLKSAPIELAAGPRPVSAPLSRILWSVQIGVVLAAAGFGMQYVGSNVDKDVSQPFMAIGVLALSIGIGFVVSAVLSYLISRRLNLWNNTAAVTE